MSQSVLADTQRCIHKNGSRDLWVVSSPRHHLAKKAKKQLDDAFPWRFLFLVKISTLLL